MDGMRLIIVLSVFLCLLNLNLPSGRGQDAWEKTSTLGPVSITVRLSPREPVIGDTLDLQIDVTAANNVEVLMPEFGEALGRFQVADFHDKESLTETGSTLYSQSYSLYSPPSGEHAIPPILVEFVDRRPGEQEAPEGLDAYELFSERIDFKIASVAVADASAELNPAMGKIEPYTSPTESVRPWIAWAIGSILGLAIVGLLFVLIFFRTTVVRRSAYELARKQLDQLMNQPQPSGEEIDEFYVALTSIIRTYLENRFSLRAPELTTEEFLSDVAESAVLSHAHKKLLNDFLKHADLVKFAGVKPGPDDISETLSRASQFLDETKENAPMVLVENQQWSAETPSPREARRD